MSAQRRGTGDAQSPNRQGHKRDSQVNPSYIYAPASSESINYPDYVAYGGAGFVPNESPWRARPEAVSEDDLYPLDLSKKRETLQTSSPNHPDYVVSGGADFVPNESPWQARADVVSEDDLKPLDLSKPKETLQTSSPNYPVYGASGGTDFIQNESPRETRYEVASEDDLYPMDLTKQLEKLQTSSPKKSSVDSGLDCPNTTKTESSMDKDAGGAAGSQNAPLLRGLLTSGLRNDQIQFTLLDRELWVDLCRLGNEMIVRYDGCFMSPCLRFTISGLVKNKLYSIYLEFPQGNKYTWRYDKSTWKITSTAEVQKKVPIVKHMMSPSPGGYWMDGALNFPNIRLSSNIDTDDPDLVGLNVSQVYQPRITVIEVDECDQLKMGTRVSVSFDETVFIVISGNYHNPQVQILKSTI